MSQSTSAREGHFNENRQIKVKASRPAIVDLRFREDAWVVEEDTRAHVRLGDYTLTSMSVTSLDTPALNTLLMMVRVGQARRHQSQQRRMVH